MKGTNPMNLKTGKHKLLVIDARYRVLDGLHVRAGVSYGPNYTHQMAGGFLAPTVRDGDRVFGIHSVMTNGDIVEVVDSWLESVDATDITDENQARKKAVEILSAIPDEEYKLLCEFDGVEGEVCRTPLHDWRLMSSSGRFCSRL